MMRLLNQQLGKLLLVLAIGLTVLGFMLSPPPKSEPLPEELTTKPVNVELDKKSLATASSEVFFAPDSPEYAGGDRFIFVPERRIVEFVPIDLDIPPATVMRAPQLLPEPGPSLEGSHKLLRFGDELPPVAILDKTGASAPVPATGAAGATTSPVTGTAAPKNGAAPAPKSGAAPAPKTEKAP